MLSFIRRFIIGLVIVNMKRIAVFRKGRLLFISLLFFTCVVKFGSTSRADYLSRGEWERRLVYDLFQKRGYNPLIRPVENNNESLKIEFNLALSQIINVDEVNQMMKTNVWLQIYWHDYQLKWNPHDYGQIQTIHVKPEDIWVPDFVLFNNADGNYEVTFKSNTLLSSNSLVYWIPPAIYKSSCSIDVQYFPFDQQICEMKFGSWTHKGKALTYSFYKNMDKLDLVDYLRSGSWDIIDCPGRIDTIRDEVTGEERQLIVFKFILRRKTLFYTVNLIIPCVLISFVSICVFALPADAGEKITLCISVLVALVVFLLLVTKILPPSLTIPLIAKYLLFTFLMNLIAIFATVVIINRNYRTPKTHKMPQWVRVIFLRELPKYLFMKRPDHDERWQSKPPSPPQSLASGREYWREDITNPCSANEMFEFQEVHHPHCKLNTMSGSQKEYRTTQSTSSSHSNLSHICQRPTPVIREDSSDSDQFNVTPELCKSIEAIKFIHQHLQTEEDYEMILEDWKYVARVLDRLLLIVFLIVTLAGTVGILLNAPHILEFVDQEQIIKELLDYTRRVGSE